MVHPARRVVSALAFAAMTLSTLSLVTLDARAQAPAVLGGEPEDYAAEAWGDPWDYANEEDQVIAADGPMQGATAASISGGQLHFDIDRPGYFHPLWGGYPGSIAHGRDGALRPVDTSRYTRIVFRMNATAEVPAGVRWYTCREISDACQGGFNFFTKPGWHTYDFPLEAIDQPALRVPWAGEVVSLRIALSPSSSTHFDVDWVRLVPSGLASVGEDVGPVPVIDEPDAAGGTDYAATARGGDLWDFDQPTDVHRINFVAGGVSGGRFEGTNAAPAMNDPSIVLRLGPAFSGDDFHRLTVRYRYEGGFSLENRPGGGTVARAIWRTMGTRLTKDGSDLQNSDDIVTYPNQPSFSVDLATSPSAAITDPAQNGPRVGWAGQMIEMLRLDPNEDPGPRRWVIEDVRLADDDRTGTDGSFEIVWHDAAWQPGTTAQLFFDTDDRGFNGRPIAAPSPVLQGPNRYRWVPPADVRGLVHVYVVAQRNGRTGRSYATGPVKVSGPGPAPQYRFGPLVGGPSSQAGVIDKPAAGSGASPTAIGPAADTGPRVLALTTGSPRGSKTTVKTTVKRGTTPSKNSKK